MRVVLGRLHKPRNRAGGFCDENCMNSEAVNLIFGTESGGSGFLRFGVLPGFNLPFGFYLAKRQVSASRKLAGWCTRRAFVAYVHTLSVFALQKQTLFADWLPFVD